MPRRRAHARSWRRRGSVAALLLTGGLLLSGCGWPDRQPGAGGPGDTPARGATRPAPTTTSRPAPFLTLHVQDSTKRELDGAIALVRRHREFADQRGQEIRRHGWNQLKRLDVTDQCGGFGCRGGVLAISEFIEEIGACYVDLYMSVVREEALDWRLPVRQVLALTLVHEQEHCLREPGHPEKVAIEAQIRFARKIGDPDLIEYASSSMDKLTPEGHYKD